MVVSNNFNHPSLMSNLLSSEVIGEKKIQKNEENFNHDEIALLNLYQNTTDYQNTSFASEFGFRVDERGIFEKSLLRAANLPLSYDINIKSVQLIAKEMQKQNSSLELSRIDLPGLLNHYHTTLKAVESEFSMADNHYLTRFEISKLAQGFSTQSGEFDGKITRVYEDLSSLNKALEDNKIINPLKLDNKIINFNFSSALNNTAQNELIKPYLNSDGAVSKSGLLMNFIHKDLKAQNERVDFFIEPMSLNLSSHQNFQAMLEGKTSFDEYIKEENKEQMSFDLYLYINGVDKKNSNNDKLSVLYQQYLNYQKDMNIKEFTNSSSIYQMYQTELSQSFESMKADFNTANKQELATINEIRAQNEQSFTIHRKQQFLLDQINKAYASIMA